MWNDNYRFPGPYTVIAKVSEWFWTPLLQQAIRSVAGTGCFQQLATSVRYGVAAGAAPTPMMKTPGVQMDNASPFNARMVADTNAFNDKDIINRRGNVRRGWTSKKAHTIRCSPAPTLMKQLFPWSENRCRGQCFFLFTMPPSLPGSGWHWHIPKNWHLSWVNQSAIITQKELMVQYHVLCAKAIAWTSVVRSLRTNKEITGQVALELIDPITNQSVDGWFRNMF